MKVRDLIRKMSDDTTILIYESYTVCAMPIFGDCREGREEADCRDCSHYIGEKSESTTFYGKVIDCPIKFAELTVQEINNAAHEVWKGKSGRRKSTVHVIAIRVNR